MSPVPASSAHAPPGPQEARCRPGPDRLAARTLSVAHALATVVRASLTAFDRSPKPAQRYRLKGSSPFDGSLRPDEPPDAGGRSTSTAGPRRTSARTSILIAPQTSSTLAAGAPGPAGRLPQCRRHMLTVVE
jgi:hypothetical protein